MGVDHRFKQPHDNRRLVVDNVIVEQGCLVQIIQRLSDGMGAVRTVNGDGLALVGFEEAKLMISFRKLVTGNLLCHEVSKGFFDPDVFKPFQ